MTATRHNDIESTDNDRNSRQRRPKRITLANRTARLLTPCPNCSGTLFVSDERQDWFVCSRDDCRYNRQMSREVLDLRDGKRAQIVFVTVDCGDSDGDDDGDDGSDGGDRR